jgi:hypothetical protein
MPPLSLPRAFPRLALLLLALLIPGTSSVVFHATYKRGPKSAGNPITCAAQCDLVGSCVGYEMAVRANASACKLLNAPPTHAKDDTWIYASAHRLARVSSLGVLPGVVLFTIYTINIERVRRVADIILYGFRIMCLNVRAT